MAGRKKGFDPLSSLFEIPDPAAGVPLPPIDPPDEDEGRGADGRTLEMTDPFYKAPPGIEVTEVSEPLPPESSVEATQVSVAVPGLELPEPGQVAPPAAPPSAAEKAQIAKALVAAAQARVAAEKPAAPAGPSDAEKARIAKALVASAKAKSAAQAPSPEAGPSDAEKARIAKALVAAAQARAKAAAPPAPEPAPEPQLSRLERAAAAGRPRSALEAARQAAKAEEKAATQQKEVAKVEKQAARIRREHALTDTIQSLLPSVLPGSNAIYVANAMVADPRDILLVLWKAHRARFIGEGELERAVGAAAVLHALENVAEGQLVAAHVVTDASDYLVWLDVSRKRLIAAFADARAYFAARQ